MGRSITMTLDLTDEEVDALRDALQIVIALDPEDDEDDVEGFKVVELCKDLLERLPEVRR